jgi:ABC-2 type transport system ATP-binding protein
MTPIIDARGLAKRFGSVQALDGLDLTIEPGQLVALLGPNGAGKTTFVRTIATLVRPDAGTVLVDGHDVVDDPVSVRRAIGLAGQHAAVEPALTGRENLALVGRLFGHPRRRAQQLADAVLEQLALTDDGGRLVRDYSGGMRRRLDLGASLVGAPKLLLLDEPTTGLDPASRLALWDTIGTLTANGTEVLLTTQYLDEADRLADRIVIIDHGRVIADGTPTQLKQQTGGEVIELHTPTADGLAAASAVLASLGAGEPQTDRAVRRVTVAVDDGDAQLAEAVHRLHATGVAVDGIALRRPTLDEVFLSLTHAAPHAA